MQADEPRSLDKEHPGYGYRVAYSSLWGWVLVNDLNEKMLDEGCEPMWWRTKAEAEKALAELKWN